MTQKFLGHPLLVFYPPKAARKVLAKPKYSAHLYEARSGFSILTEEYLTFQRVFPRLSEKSSRDCNTPYTYTRPEADSRFSLRNI